MYLEFLILLAYLQGKTDGIRMAEEVIERVSLKGGKQRRSPDSQAATQMVEIY